MTHSDKGGPKTPLHRPTEHHRVAMHRWCPPQSGTPQPTVSKAPDVSLLLILLGAPLVSIAMFNKVPQVLPARVPAQRQGAATVQRARPRVRLTSARLTEQGRALFTTIGGSVLIVAFFLTLSGL